MKGFLVAPLALFLVIGAAPSQGQALPFHTETAMTAGFNENAARHFVSLRGRGGLARGGRSVTDPMRRDVDALAVVNGVVLGAFSPLWTVSVVVPWVRKRMEFTPTGEARDRYSTSGVGDVLVQTKRVFYRNDRPGATTRFAVRARVQLPTGRTDAPLPDGPVAPRGLQAGTGSWALEPRVILTNVDGRWGLHGNVAARFGTADDDFDPGDALFYDAAIGFRLLPSTYASLDDRTLVTYLEVSGEVAGQDVVDGAADGDSGGHLLWLSPTLQWIPAPWVLAEAALRVPVIQDLNGAQLRHDVRFEVGGRYRFSIFR